MTVLDKVAAVDNLSQYRVESFQFDSSFLDRVVKLDAYLPITHHPANGMSLLIVNDGQDLPKMPFASIVDDLLKNDLINPIMVVGIHCNEDRKLEYGTADLLDFMNRGARARYHRKFVIKELLPMIRQRFHPFDFADTSFAGFSLGGLSALDIAWKHPEIFSKVGVFSGSLWWRLRDLNDGYEEETDRVMHKLVREGTYASNLKFFFETGTLDEKMDRNHNGIIDSIDDTLDLIKELEAKGYNKETDIHYLELADGKHDVLTWARAFPEFLKWGWGKK
jgi:enterochelin esterase-like enzyme